MEFFTKTLGNFSLSSSAFSRGAPVATDPAYPTIWAITDGVVKKDKRPCTLFEFDGTLLQNQQRLPLAENMLKMLRKLRIPGIAKILDSEQAGQSLVIATERLTPISDRLPHLSVEAKKWGLQTVLTTLATLHEHTKCIHGNINLGTIYENADGEWVLCGLEIASFEDDLQAGLAFGSMLPSTANTSWLPQEILSQGWSAAGRPGVSLDTYEFGRLIYGVFHGDKTAFTGSLANFAASLTRAKRQSIQSITKQASCLDTAMTKIAESTKHVVMMNDYDFRQFLQLVDANVHLIPSTFVGGRLLPELIKATSNGRGGIEAVKTVLSLCSSVSAVQFQDHVLPYILALFGSLDRSVRLELLTSLPGYVDKIPESVAQTKILPAMATGFSDTEPIIRTESLKAVGVLAPKLSQRQVNGDLLRLLARTNSDSKPEIRAQTISLLSELASLMVADTRSSVVVTALARALKDPDGEVRSNALAALTKTSGYFSPHECAEKLIGPAAISLLDKDFEVRMEAKTVFANLLAKIENASAGLDSSLEDGKLRAQQPRAASQYDSSAAASVGSFTHTHAKTSKSDETQENIAFGLLRRGPTGGVVEESGDFRLEDEIADDPAAGWDNWDDDRSSTNSIEKSFANDEHENSKFEPDDDTAEGWDW